MSTVAKLTVDLLADAKQFERTLRSTESQTRSWEKGISGSLSSMRAGFIGAAAAAGTATIAAAKAIGQQTDEMLRLSETANMGFEEFQAFTHATSQYGIEAAKVADISKDVQDKLGDFIATGGGEFKDFFEQVAPKVGLTAQSLQGLAGPEVLQRVKNAMDQANVSMEEQVFYLEAIANDASLLAPLLADNGAEAQRMAEEFERTNRAISEQDAEKLRTMNRSFNDMAKAAQTAATNIIAKLAPAITALNRALTDMMAPESATESVQTALDKLDAGIQAKQAEIKSIQNMTTVDVYKSKSTGYGYFNKRPADIEAEKNRQLAEANRVLQTLIDQRASLQSQLDALNTLDEPAVPKIQAEIPITPTLTGTGTDTSTADADREARERLRMEADLARLQESFLTEMELIDLHEQQKLEKLEVWRQADIAGMENYESLKTQIQQQADTQRNQMTQANNRMLLSNSANLFGSMADLAGTFAGEQSGLYKTMFAVSKAFSIAESIIAIQTGIAKAAANPFPANLAAMASVAAATMGIVSTITSTQMQGIAHSGIDSIPKEGTWLLDKGERVVDSSTNRDLKQYLNGQNQSANNGGWQVIINEAPPGTTATVDERAQIVEIAVGQAVSTIENNVQRGGNSTASAFETSYGLNRAWGI